MLDAVSEHMKILIDFMRSNRNFGKKKTVKEATKMANMLTIKLENFQKNIEAINESVQRSVLLHFYEGDTLDEIGSTREDLQKFANENVDGVREIEKYVKKI